MMLKSVPFAPPAWASALRRPPAQKLRLGHFPTPIMPFSPPGLPEGVRMFIKRDDFSGMETSGNKIRKLEFLLAEALEHKADCIVTCGGIQSNHCRATAAVARMLGLDSYLLLRTNKPDEDPGLVGNVLFDRMLDANLIQMSRQEYGKYGSEAMIKRTCDRLKQEGRRPYAIPVGGSNGLGTWGYIQAIDEINSQLKDYDLPVTDIAFACGSGGTAAGIGLGSYLYAKTHPNSALNFDAKIPAHAYIVCDNDEYFHGYIDNKILPAMGAPSDISSRQFLQITNAQGTGYARSTKQELEYIYSVSRTTGVLMDPVYSGKALFHLIRELNDAPEKFVGKTILFVHTGGQFGMYDKVDALQEVIRQDQVNRFEMEKRRLPQKSFARTYYKEFFSCEVSRLRLKEKDKNKIKMVFTPSDDEKTLGHAVNERSNAESRSSTEARNPASSTSTARIPQPIFAFVMPPKVSSIARDELVEWLKLRKEYEETMKERCKDGKEDIGTVMKSVKNSFDEYLLETLCEVSWGVTVDKVTDDFLLEQIHAITDSYQNQVLPPVNELFQKELRMDMNNMDITSRVTNYFMSCNTLIKKYGFTSFFEEEHGSKKKCKLIVNSLPAALKEKVKNEIDYRFPEAQSNVMKLYKLICQQALEEAIEHRALNRERKLIHKQKQREQPHPFQKNKRQNTGQQQKADKYPKKGGKVVQPAAESSGDNKEQPGQKGAPKTGCFHCGGPHYLSGCPTANKEDRDRLANPKQNKRGGEHPAGRHR